MKRSGRLCGASGDGEFSAFSKRKIHKSSGNGVFMEGWSSASSQGRAAARGMARGQLSPHPGASGPLHGPERVCSLRFYLALSIPPISWTPPFHSVLAMYLNLLFLLPGFCVFSGNVSLSSACQIPQLLFLAACSSYCKDVFFKEWWTL